MAKEDWEDVARTWRDLSSGLKGVFWLCIVCSVLVGGAGILLDLNGGSWWTEKPFLVNLVSSTTVALVSVPLGLVLLKTITVRQEERVEKLRAFRIARASTKELSECAENLTVGTGNPENLLTLLDNTHRYVYWCSEQLRKTNVSRPRDFQGQLDRLADPVLEADRAYTEFANAPVGGAVLRLEDTWRHWDAFVRPKLRSAGVERVTNGIDSEGRTLEWRDLFASVEFANGDLRPDIALFRSNGQIGALQARLLNIEASLAERQNSVRNIMLLVDFATRLRNEVGKYEESDITKGIGRPRLFTRVKARLWPPRAAR